MERYMIFFRKLSGTPYEILALVRLPRMPYVVPDVEHHYKAGAEFKSLSLTNQELCCILSGTTYLILNCLKAR